MPDEFPWQMFRMPVLTAPPEIDMTKSAELRAHQRAEAHDGGLRLVTPADSAFARICALVGLDGNIPHFPTVKQALAQPSAAATGRYRSEPP